MNSPELAAGDEDDITDAEVPGASLEEALAIRRARHAELINATVDFFAPAGPLAQAEKFGGRPYEYRPQQVRMAESAAAALRDGHNLCVEAPTGVGKSFAYLVPAIRFAINEKKPVVISTETINLQEQLMDKDVPLLRQLLGLDFKAAVAKGRGNYVCRRRLEMAVGERQMEFFPQESALAEAKRVLRWLDSATDGSRSEMPFTVDPAVWSSISSETGNCRGPKCPHFKTCFYWQARRSWDDADLIIANHALFFADLKMRQLKDLEATLLPNYSAVIVDESHTLEDNAAEHLGLRVSQSGLLHFLHRLFNRGGGSGLLLKAGKEALELRETIVQLEDLAATFFKLATDLFTQHDDTVFRVNQPLVLPDLLSDKLGVLKRQLEAYVLLQEDENLKLELTNLDGYCSEYMDGIFSFLNMTLPDHVYWMEEGDRGGITLQAAPLNVNMLLYQMLFSKGFPVILTSATLTVRRSLDYYRGRVGYGNGVELVLDSPFDPEQVELYIPRDIPDPNDEDFAPSLLRQIEKFVTLTHGKAFVLFTSYKTLEYCADRMEDFFRDMGITLLVQGKELSRTAMLKKFKEDIDSVIFGATSFWTGVDVPGEALSNVIVTKLPFPVPSHPLIEARSERIRALGGNPFMDYSLPEAVLKLRQGVGRLIRSKTDHGIIAILDRRVLTKRYGAGILDSLPPYPLKVC